MPGFAPVWSLSLPVEDYRFAELAACAVGPARCLENPRVESAGVERRGSSYRRGIGVHRAASGSGSVRPGRGRARGRLGRRVHRGSGVGSEADPAVGWFRSKRAPAAIL
jgi:hypothetical protein